MSKTHNEICLFIDKLNRPKKRKRRVLKGLSICLILVFCLSVSASLITSFLTVDVEINASDSLFFDNTGLKTFNDHQGGDSVSDWINITNVNENINYILDIQNTTTEGLTVEYINPITVNANSYTNLSIIWHLDPYIDTSESIQGTIEILPLSYTEV